MESIYVGEGFDRSFSFVTEKGLYLGFPNHWVNYWTFEGRRLSIIFPSHTIELEGIYLEKIIHLLEEGRGFKLLQAPKRYFQNNNERVFVWGMNFISNG